MVPPSRQHPDLQKYRRCARRALSTYPNPPICKVPPEVGGASLSYFWLNGAAARCLYVPLCPSKLLLAHGGLRWSTLQPGVRLVPALYEQADTDAQLRRDEPAKACRSATSSSERLSYSRGLSTLPGLFGLGFVDFVGLNRQIGEDRDAGATDLDVSRAVTEEVLWAVFAIRRRHHLCHRERVVGTLEFASPGDVTISTSSEYTGPSRSDDFSLNVLAIFQLGLTSSIPPFSRKVSSPTQRRVCRRESL